MDIEAYERLRLSQKAHEEAMSEAGRDVGKRWALKYADYAELEHLARCEKYEGIDYESSRSVGLAASPESDLREFWAGVLNSPEDDRYLTSSDWLFGFCEASLEVYNDYIGTTPEDVEQKSA